MARVSIGLTCAAGHFNEIGQLWEPVKDKDIDKLAERARMPLLCELLVGPAPAGNRPSEWNDPNVIAQCGGAFVGLPHIYGRQREGEGLARVGGQNVHAGLTSRPQARPQEGPLSPSEWKRRIWDRQRERPGGPALCAVTREPLSWTADEVHHPLEKGLLRARGLHEHVWDDRNGIAVRRRVHERHTNRSEPIRRIYVPASAYEFARELGPWAVARIDEKHPR